MQKKQGVLSTTTISRGGVSCANGFFLADRKHEIKAGEPIKWVNVVLKNGQKKLLGYCVYCYQDLYTSEVEEVKQDLGVDDGTT